MHIYIPAARVSQLNMNETKLQFKEMNERRSKLTAIITLSLNIAVEINTQKMS